MVYEAEIVSVDTRAGRAEVRFIGFGNKETKVGSPLMRTKFLIHQC